MGRAAASKKRKRDAQLSSLAVFRFEALSGALSRLTTPVPAVTATTLVGIGHAVLPLLANESETTFLGTIDAVYGVYGSLPLESAALTASLEDALGGVLAQRALVSNIVRAVHAAVGGGRLPLQPALPLPGPSDLVTSPVLSGPPTGTEISAPVPVQPRRSQRARQPRSHFRPISRQPVAAPRPGHSVDGSEEPTLTRPPVKRRRIGVSITLLNPHLLAC